MKALIAARALLAGLLVPGLGYALSNRFRPALVTASLYFAVVLVFSWTRLVLTPGGYYATVALAITVVLGTAVNAAWLAFGDYGNDQRRPRWKPVIGLTVLVITVAWLVAENRAKVLGFETYRMPASNMSPTLAAGDLILADTWYYADSEPEIGDVVVFFMPDGRSVKYVKRIIGLPGDSIGVRDGHAVRNGMLLDEPYASFTGPATHARNFRVLQLEDNAYFVLGDNRDNSRDSRFFGAVPRDYIHGRVVHRWFGSDSDFPTRLD